MHPEPMQQEGYDFMSAAFEVYNHLGNAYTEDVHQESLELELAARQIPCTAQPELTIQHKGQPPGRRFRPDLLANATIIVELKSASAILPEHEAQFLNYLNATAKPVGYLVNFRCRDRLEWKGFVRTRSIGDNQRKAAIL